MYVNDEAVRRAEERANEVNHTAQVALSTSARCVDASASTACTNTLRRQSATANRCHTATKRPFNYLHTNDELTNSSSS